MTSWSRFTEEAPSVATVFTRRHRAAGNLCLLATLRADGSPRISPVEPMIFDGALLIVGMPHTRKFDDLARDHRFCLHTATVDTQVGDGDAKLFGTVTDVTDKRVHDQFTHKLFEERGLDFREEEFDHFFVADLTGASSVEVADGHMDVTVWKPGEGERVVRKH
ncbi:pyridoxamine 5'-phosphate oxidase family protein [Nocardia callitridis]|uniref:Pyridoxamine 5'-phosphate oxidase family protein n=1 Tax=Nocardia callitridis TaxID=648753 RepID=A0ABP9KLL7_9NOCA